MYKIKICSVFSFLMLTFWGLAQQSPIDTATSLKTVEVSTTFVRVQSTGNRIQVLDSTLLNNYATSNLGDLLNAESDVYVKSYGLSALATTSIRGGGSNHTAILWNGFNLQNPMYGPQDLSLLGINFFNEVMIQYGSSGATWGSGAVGGAIHLNNIPVYNKGISVRAGSTWGSFADMQQHVGIEWSRKKVVSTLKMTNHSAKNDFPFQNTLLPERPIQKQTNAELKQIGFLNENYFQINQNQKINLLLWYQNADRNIPPSMGQVVNVSNRKDESFRITTEWQRSVERFVLKIRAAHFYETLLYDDYANLISSVNKSKTTIAETEGKFYLTQLTTFTIAVNNTYAEGVSKGYEKQHSQNKFALIGSYRIHNKRDTWNGFLNIRKEIITPETGEVDSITYVPFKSNPVLVKANQPLTYSIAGDGKLFKWLSVNVAVAQHYRIPSFNDLYWVPGGNIRLKPENGWGEECGISFKHNLHRLDISANASFFNRIINNWILWLPNELGFWSADNVLKVWSRGAEYRLTLKYPVQKVLLALNVLWNYTVSTNEQTIAANDESIGKQLIYTPMYKGNGSLGVTFKNFNITYYQKYVGYTYTSSDNKHFLNPYLLGDIKLSQQFIITAFKLQVFAGAYNLFNCRYEVIDSRPMPGRSYQLGCTFYFNQSNNN